ncbi:Transmembrane region of lysyl-tRNA synthetase [Brevibacterium sp. 239c]|nr:Transmembrane region of lysyl-tRNA synthetase [Brevibacterium sp. 239c]
MFVRWLPRLLVLIAVLMPLQILIPSDRWVGTGLSFLWAWVVPANPVDFVSSVVLVILAGALSIRKRAAWWVLLLLLVFTLVATGAVAVVLALVKSSLLTWDLDQHDRSGPCPHLSARPSRSLHCQDPAVGLLQSARSCGQRSASHSPCSLGGPIPRRGLSLSQARQIIAELFGFRDCTDSSWMLSLFGFGSVTSIILAFWTMLRSQRFAEHIDLDEERAIRQSLADHSNDSLGYFSTRRDRSALFAGDFSLADLPEVQRAVANLTRLGYTLRIRQQSETPADELASLAAFADEWRDGETERGFSMALGRMGDSADARTLHVEALFPAHDAKHPPPSRRRERGHRIHDRRAHA